MYDSPKFRFANDLGLLCKGLLTADNHQQFLSIAKQSPFNRLQRDIESAVEKSLSSTDSMSELVHWESHSESFLSTLHNSILDNVSDFRLAPVRTNIFVGEGVTVGIVGEHQPMPVAGRVRRYFLELLKTGSIQVFTKEQITSNAYNAEAFLTAAMRNLATSCSNKAFIELVTQGDSNSLSVASTGESAAQIVATLNLAINGIELKETTSLILLTDVQTCSNISCKADSDGNPAFPNVHATQGGEIINGVRLMPVGDGQLPEQDSDGKFAILFDADSILINKGSLYFSRTEQAAVELSDSPDAENPQLISLFQCDAIGLKVVRTFAAEQIRNGVVTISGVGW